MFNKRLPSFSLDVDTDIFAPGSSFCPRLDKEVASSFGGSRSLVFIKMVGGFLGVVSLVDLVGVLSDLLLKKLLPKLLEES